VGYLSEGDVSDYRTFVITLLRMATEPCRELERYAFGSSDLVQRMSNILIEMRLRKQYGKMPPPDVLFLHRKLGGLYLLLSRLRASIPVHKLILNLPQYSV
jgi:hypothetical protein